MSFSEVFSVFFQALYRVTMGHKFVSFQKRETEYRPLIFRKRLTHMREMEMRLISIRDSAFRLISVSSAFHLTFHEPPLYKTWLAVRAPCGVTIQSKKERLG